MDIDRDPKNPDMYTIRHDDKEYTVTAPNVTFLGEFLLEPDTNTLGDDVRISTPLISEIITNLISKYFQVFPIKSSLKTRKKSPRIITYHPSIRTDMVTDPQTTAPLTVTPVLPDEMK